MIIKPPTLPPYIAGNPHLAQKPSLFLAGSIEMGKAEDWQERVGRALEDKFLILNPRRNAIDWKEGVDIQNMDDANFREQVEWELDCQAGADARLIYFAPSTLSPISLLELGMFFPDIVICPVGFWRKGNVDLVCERRGTPVVTSLDEAIKWLKHDWRWGCRDGD